MLQSGYVLLKYSCTQHPFFTTLRDRARWIYGLTQYAISYEGCFFPLLFSLFQHILESTQLGSHSFCCCTLSSNSISRQCLPLLSSDFYFHFHLYESRQLHSYFFFNLPGIFILSIVYIFYGTFRKQSKGYYISNSSLNYTRTIS